MQVFVAFLLIAFFLGGTRLGRRVRERPVLLMAFCFLAATSFYSLSVVL